MLDRWWFPKAFALALLFPILLLLLQSRTCTHLGDPDRFYHFALSRELVAQHAYHLNTLPQAEDLDWDNYFPDKEYLFHVLTRTGFALGGERGVELSVLAAACGGALVLFWFALGSLPPGLAFACAFAAFFTHSLVFRMLFVRPHVLAIFLFLWLSAAIARRRMVSAAVAAAAYALAYHAFYIPFFCSVIVAVLAGFERPGDRRRLFELAAAVAAGTAIGLVINPYFPSNLTMGILSASIPFLMKGVLHSAKFGAELYPLGAPGWIKFYYFPCAVLGGALALRLFRDFSTRFLLVLTLFFGLLSFQTLRAGEYFVPAAGLLLPLVVAGLRWRPWIFAVAALQLLAMLYVAVTETKFIPDRELHNEIRSAIAVIPHGARKVYNCEWDTSPILFEARPDLLFVDLLDPSFLFDVNPVRYQQRMDLGEGKITDVRAMLDGYFHSDYVLCRTPVLMSQLERDPGMQRLFPPVGRVSPVALYRILPAPNPAFVHRLKRYFLTPQEAARARDFRPRSDRLEDITLPDPVVVLGLQTLGRPDPRCVQVRADPKEILAHQGAAFLGVGGGGAIRAWRNSRPVFSSGPSYGRARSVQALVRLDPPLRERDQIDLLVCSGPAFPYWSVALSLWSPAAVREVCRGKAAAKGGNDELEASSPLTTDRSTCLGELAGEAVPPDLRP